VLGVSDPLRTLTLSSLLTLSAPATNPNSTPLTRTKAGALHLLLVGPPSLHERTPQGTAFAGMVFFATTAARDEPRRVTHPTAGLWAGGGWAPIAQNQVPWFWLVCQELMK
jgi:hypothetical protein